jgi:RNA polymerase sigma-70 factor (ECF subfamily)
MESITFAFLLALEALTPHQRAVLLLRDVFDYSVRETADALGISEASVKTTHHRARHAMRDYDQHRCPPTRALADETRTVLGRLLASFASADVAAIETLLADDVRALSDGGGEFLAARVPVVGRHKVAVFYWKIGARRLDGSRAEVRILNGLPALVIEFGEGLPKEAKRITASFVLDREGRIRAIHTVLATRKLTAVRF